MKGRRQSERVLRTPLNDSGYLQAGIHGHSVRENFFKQEYWQDHPSNLLFIEQIADPSKQEKE